jgi:hypothetical protein
MLTHRFYRHYESRTNATVMPSTDPNSPDPTGDGPALLRQIIEQAVETGANEIDLERVPEGLEVCFLVGHTGIGDLWDDREAETALISEIIDRAGLDRRSRGAFEMEVSGKRWKIAVQERESFGELCYRLRLQPPTSTRKPS